MPVAIDYTDNSPRYSGGPTGRQATIMGVIAGTDIDALFGELFPIAISGIPQLPALLAGSSALYADNVEYEPLGKIVSCSPLPLYEKNLVTITYKTIPYQQANPSTDQILTYAAGIGGEFMTLPKMSLRWKAGAVPVQTEDISAGKVITSIDHDITLHFVPDPPYATLRGLVGKINNATFEGGPTGTILLLGANLRQTVNSDGAQPWEVGLKFAERIIDGDSSLTWNHFYRPDAQAPDDMWQELESNNGAPIYASGNFASLY